jgi:hypothetical protein
MAEYGQPIENSEVFHTEKSTEWMGGKSDSKCSDQAGCTTPKSWENLKRRLLHAIMTEDVFVFAMGGHSAAAGVSRWRERERESENLRCRYLH